MKGTRNEASGIEDFDLSTAQKTTQTMHTPFPKLGNSHLIWVIAFVSFGVYSNALFNGFVLDDNLQLLNNPWIKHLKYIPQILTSNFWAFQDEATNLYRPLPFLFYTILYHTFGFQAWAFHLLNVLLHTGVSILVFLIASRLITRGRAASVSSWIPLLAGVLFATHPVHTEAVAWIGGIMDVSFTFFFLLSFHLYLIWREEDESCKAAYTLSAVSFFFATLCKEPALSLPIILLAYECLNKKAGADLSWYLKKYRLYFVVVCVYLVMRFYALEGFAPMKGDLGLTPFEVGINVLVLFRQYLEKLALPIQLNFWHVFHPITSLLTTSGILSLVALAFFVWALRIALKKDKKTFLFLIMIATPLLPVLYIPALTQGIGNAFTERYLYLPSVGFILILASSMAWVNEKRPRWNRVVIAFSCAVVILYGGSTIHRNFVWKDSISLWSDAQKKSPESANPYLGLGDAFKERGWIEKALEQYHAALKLKPNWVPIRVNLGDAYLAKNLVDKGIEYYLEALRLKPDSVEAHNGLGLAYWRKGLVDQAIKHYQAALRLKPHLQGIHNNLGLAYASKGWVDKAIGEYQIALQSDPSSSGVHNNLGNAYESKGWTDKAIHHYEESLKLQPDYVDAHNNIAIVFVEKGSIDRAIKHFEVAAALSPKDPEIHLNLAHAYKVKGLPEKAEEHLREAKRLSQP